MKTRRGLAGVSLEVAVATIFAAAGAWAGAPDEKSEDASTQSAQATDQQATPATADEEPIDMSDAENYESEEGSDEDAPKAPPPTVQEVYDGLIAISPPGGMQLPPPPETDYSDWQSVNVGFVSMLVPPGWTIQNQIGEAGAEDQTIGLAPESGDIYVELRQIQNSDSNYMQTFADHIRSDYSRSPDRLKEHVIFGFQPMVLDGAVGGLEIMNQFGKEKNEDGTPTFRMISWQGRWDKNDAIQKVEFTATFGQDQQEKFAPLVSSILATFKTSNIEAAK
jgi:hypothetical protein